MKRLKNLLILLNRKDNTKINWLNKGKESWLGL